MSSRVTRISKNNQDELDDREKCHRVYKIEVVASPYGRKALCSDCGGAICFHPVKWPNVTLKGYCHR